MLEILGCGLYMSFYGTWTLALLKGLPLLSGTKNQKVIGSTPVGLLRFFLSTPASLSHVDLRGKVKSNNCVIIFN